MHAGYNLICAEETGYLLEGAGENKGNIIADASKK